MLLEGGPHLAGAFLDAGEIDEIRLFLAPLLLGGGTARDPLEGEGVERISEAMRALTLDCEPVGSTCSSRPVCGSGDVFTGLIADLGEVVTVTADARGSTLEAATALTGELGDGDSVAVNGVCLTATGVTGEGFRAQAILETLQRSSLGRSRAARGSTSSCPCAPTDGWAAHRAGPRRRTARVTGMREEGFSRVLRIECDPGVLRYLVFKGSIAVDGVSLTVSDLDDHGFSVSLIPETLQRTTLGRAREGDIVNLEVDVLAKHVERLLPAHRAVSDPERV